MTELELKKWCLELAESRKTGLSIECVIAEAEKMEDYLNGKCGQCGKVS